METFLRLEMMNISRINDEVLAIILWLVEDIECN